LWQARVAHLEAALAGQSAAGLPGGWGEGETPITTSLRALSIGSTARAGHSDKAGASQAHAHTSAALAGAFADGPSARPGVERALLEVDEPQSESEAYCSKQDVQSVLSSSDQTGTVLGMMATNPNCALCIIPCGSRGMPDALPCILACSHQRENKCDDSTGLARIMPLVDQASLQNRSLIVRMLELVEADCAYCILETVASVCGEDCVKESLHLVTDYPILPRACWPRLGDALATAQKEAMSRLLEAGMPFGVTTAAVRDQFVATGELVHGMAV
jgi:hypothetical protein